MSLAGVRDWIHPPGQPGRRLAEATWAGTVVFAVVAGLATAFGGPLVAVSVVVDLVLFGIGCVAFLVAYGIAVGRSRTDAIGIGGLYFLAGSAPGPVQRSFMTALGVQVTVAFVTASIRIFTPLAFGILVPVHAMGLAGVWAARYGHFDPRRARPADDSGSDGNSGDRRAGDDADPTGTHRSDDAP